MLVLSASATGDVGAARTAQLPRLRARADRPGDREALWHARDQWRPRCTLRHAAHYERFGPTSCTRTSARDSLPAVFTAISSLGLPHVHTAHDLNLLCARTSMTQDFEYCGGGCAFCQVQRTSGAGRSGDT